MSKWISVKNKIPGFDEYGQIIVSNHIVGGNPPKVVIFAVCWEGVFYLLEHWGAGEKIKIDGVTHWMPLPEPPK